MGDGLKNWLWSFKIGLISALFGDPLGRKIWSGHATAQNCIWEHKTDPVDAISWLVVSFGATADQPRLKGNMSTIGGEGSLCKGNSTETSPHGYKTDPVDIISWLVVSFGPMAGRPRLEGNLSAKGGERSLCTGSQRVSRKKNQLGGMESVW